MLFPQQKREKVPKSVIASMRKKMRRIILKLYEHIKSNNENIDNQCSSEDIPESHVEILEK